VRITVLHALADRQAMVELDLEPGATAQAAVAASGLVGDAAQLGIAGRRVQPGRLLEDGDRVEILRPLEADPHEARRLRARARRRA
jgi:putative ubiquitin-RnfH superfamily antitoxin RatB of RatAB toxin-antitoxin module